jgi:hypothetical protein
MYIIGASHPNKDRTKSVLERLIRDESRLVTDTETFQEILHRYSALNRKDAIQPAYEVLLSIVDEIFPVAAEDVVRAKDLLLSNSVISARDAVHTSVMKNRGVDTIFSFDTGFDSFSFLTRIS